MTEVETRDIPRNWDVFVRAGIPTVTSDFPPGTEHFLNDKQEIGNLIENLKRDYIKEYKATYNEG
jgi:hypothetical protein